MKNEILIRLTNFCNESCDHCVFRSSPHYKEHFLVEKSKEINKWLPNDDINICFTGGELTLIPHYTDLIYNISQNKTQIGIITNGVFIKNKKSLNKFIDLINTLKNESITIRISQTQYHSKEEYGILAYQKLKTIFKNYKHIFIQQVGFLDLIAPLGRAYDNKIKIHQWNNSTNNYGAMCRNEAQRKLIFIDENCLIHWCPFGNSPIENFQQFIYEAIKHKIILWREEKLQEGMTCLLCSKNGVGSSNNQFVSLNIMGCSPYCMSGGFNN